MNIERQDWICEKLQKDNYISIKAIQEQFPDVSRVTIHRDLLYLEDRGRLIRVRGGAKALQYQNEPIFDERSRSNVTGKLRMAKKAAELIGSSVSIFLDAGTSIALLAKEIPDKNMIITTTSPAIVGELCKLIKPSINLCGGTINKNNLAVSGQRTLDELELINIDVAFIGASGVSVTSGFVCGQESDMLVKKKALERARTRVLLCDSEKFGRVLPFTFANWSDIDYIITDKELPEQVEMGLKAAGVKIIM